MNQIKSISDPSAGQDGQGMTPLHILACSTKQSLELYQLIVAMAPQNLISEDKWGCPPILYAIWSGAASEVIQFLIDSQRSAFPNHRLDWDKMIETLCRAGVSLDIVQLLLRIHQASFSRQNVNWQKASRELTIRILVGHNFYGNWGASVFEDWGTMMETFGASPANQELIQSLMETQKRFFADENNTNWQVLCEELVQPLKGWWRPDTSVSMISFQFLVKCSVLERLNAIGVRKWRMGIKNMVERLSSVKSGAILQNHFNNIDAMLQNYERMYQQLKDATLLLELALWKSKIVESELAHSFGTTGTRNIDQMDENTADREQCRISCGAVVVIPRVLSYLSADLGKGRQW